MLDAIVSNALLANDILIAKGLMMTDVILRCVHDGGRWNRVGGIGLDGLADGQPSCLKTITAPQRQQLSNIVAMMLLLRSPRR